MNEILTVDEVAALLLCTNETIEAHARERVIPGVKFGRAWVFPREALLQRLNEMAIAGPVARRPKPVCGVGRRQVPPELPVIPPGPARDALLKDIEEQDAMRRKRIGPKAPGEGRR